MLHKIPKLIGLDLETTGSSFSDRIVEIAMVTYHEGNQHSSWVQRINPGIKIPPATTAIHGISNEDVADCPRFSEVAGQVLSILDEAPLIGYNVIFDFNVLSQELVRAGEKPLDRRRTVLLDPFAIWKKKDPKTLSHAYQFFCEKELVDAHSAKADVDAAFEVFQAQLKRYPDLPDDVHALGAYCYPVDPSWVASSYHFVWNDKGEILCNFGKAKGTALTQLLIEKRSFLEWILKNNFPQDVKDLVEKALNGEALPEKPTV